VTAPSSPEPDPYRPTLFDRKRPDAGYQIGAAAYGLMVFALVLSVLLLVSHRLSLGGVLVAAVAGFIPYVASLALAEGAGSAWHRLMSSGASTPYEEQFSYQESLVIRGRVDDALASYEAIIAERATAAPARLRAAALYASRGDNPRRAAELLRDVMSMPAIGTRDDIEASTRLIELLMGPLGEPGRAMVELRRLMDRHPGTDAAARAKLMLAELKEEMAARAK
jgi:hypothetical protein